MPRALLLTRLGAIAYFIWGALHVLAGWKIFAMAATVSGDLVQGRLQQAGWNLICIAIGAMVIAATMNWRQSVAGYWLNLVLISATDLGFVFFLLAPGRTDLAEGLVGPAFWIVGLVLTSLAHFSQRPGSRERHLQ